MLKESARRELIRDSPSPKVSRGVGVKFCGLKQGSLARGGGGAGGGAWGWAHVTGRVAAVKARNKQVDLETTIWLPWTPETSKSSETISIACFCSSSMENNFFSGTMARDGLHRLAAGLVGRIKAGGRASCHPAATPKSQLQPPHRDSSTTSEPIACFSIDTPPCYIAVVLLASCVDSSMYYH